MKFKIAYCPQRSLWLKRLISNSLVIGLLFNSTLSSFSGVLSEDSRYETFQGNNITINNILEEDKADVEIEGNSLVNLLSSKSKEVYIHNNASSTRTRTLKTIALKPYTTYTLKTNISNTSSSSTSYLKVYYYYINEDGTTTRIYPNGFISTQRVSNGESVIKFTTKDVSCNTTSLYLYVDSKDSSTGVSNEFSFETSECILLEGDYVNHDIDYFEGIKSVGELEDNKLNIETIGENIFDVEYFTEMIEAHYDEGNYRYEVKDGRNTIWVADNHDRLYLENILSNNYKFRLC